MLRHWVGVGWTPRRTVLWRSQVEPWKTVWQCELEKKTRRVFRNKFPVIYRLSFENHFKIPGNFEPILGHESVVSLWRKRHFFLKPSKRWRGSPPAGCLCSPNSWPVALISPRSSSVMSSGLPSASSQTSPKTESLWVVCFSFTCIFASSTLAKAGCHAVTMLLPCWHFFLLRGEHALCPWQLPRQYGMRIDPSSGPSRSTSSKGQFLVLIVCFWYVLSCDMKLSAILVILMFLDS